MPTRAHFAMPRAKPVYCRDPLCSPLEHTTANDLSRCRASLTRSWDTPSTCCHRRSPYCMRTAVLLQRNFSVLVGSRCMSLQDATCRIGLHAALACMLQHAASACKTQHAHAATRYSCVHVASRRVSLYYATCRDCLHVATRCVSLHDATRSAGYHVATCRISLPDATCCIGLHDATCSATAAIGGMPPFRHRSPRVR